MKKIVFLLFIFTLCNLFAQANTTPKPTSTGSNSTIDFGQVYYFYSGGSVKYAFEPGALNTTLNPDQGGTLHGLTAYDSLGRAFYPSNYGGPVIDVYGYDRMPWDTGVTYRLISRELLSGDTVKVVYKMFFSLAEYQFYYKFKIDGKTLIIKTGFISANSYAKNKGFELDRSENTLAAEVVRIPYLTQTNILKSNSIGSTGSQVYTFTSLFFDWEVTNASTLYPNQDLDVVFNGVVQPNTKRFTQLNRYLPSTAGVTNNLNETIYLTVSTNINEVLPNLVGPTSNNGVAQYKSVAAAKTVFCYWPPYTWVLKPPTNHYNTSTLLADSRYNSIPQQYDTTGIGYGISYKLFHLLHKMGVRGLNVIIKNYQYEGFDHQLPVVLGGTNMEPALKGGFWSGNCTEEEDAQANGGIAYMNSLRTTLFTTLGYGFGLHEQYVDTYEDTPGYSTSNLALWINGMPRTNWNNGCSVSRVIKPTLAGDWATTWSNSTHLGKFSPTFSYLDVHSAANPSDFVDYQSGAEGCGLFRTVLKKYRDIPVKLRANYGAIPIQGEGGKGSMLYVGYFDDIEARLETAHWSSYGVYAPLFVDFSLRKMHEKSSLHGVGHYNCFYGTIVNNEFDYSLGNMTIEQTLTYVATELAYGHSGLITKGDEVDHTIYQAKLEHQHVYPSQLLISNSIPSSITYYNNGTSVGTASQYISNYTGWDNSNDGNFMCQVKVTYNCNGNFIRVYVNRNVNSEWNITNEVSGLSGTFYYNIQNGSAKAQIVSTSLPTTVNLAKGNGWLVYVPSGLPLQKVADLKEDIILDSALPHDFALHNNYPNPFNPETTIKYDLPEDSNIRIVLFDVLGREVKSLVNENKKAGSHSVSWNAFNYSSGVYFCKMEAASISGQYFTKTLKMLLAK